MCYLYIVTAKCYYVCALMLIEQITGLLNGVKLLCWAQQWPYTAASPLDKLVKDNKVGGR